MAAVNGPLDVEETRMSALVNALSSLLSLYGLGRRGGQRRRPAPVYIGRSGTSRLA